MIFLNQSTNSLAHLIKHNLHSSYYPYLFTRSQQKLEYIKTKHEFCSKIFIITINVYIFCLSFNVAKWLGWGKNLDRRPIQVENMFSRTGKKIFTLKNSVE